MKKKAILLLAMMAAALLVASGVALAATSYKQCKVGVTCTGTSGDDTITGTTSNDSIYGYSGNDRIYGYGGNDYMTGMDGDDQLYGTYGADRYVGGNGNDKMYDTQNSLSDAKYGDDTYFGLRGGGVDTILDSGGAFDTLDLSPLTRSQVLIAWTDISSDSDTNLDSLSVVLKSDPHRAVLVRNYFDNSGSPLTRGSGEMKIRFKDRTVGFPASEG